MNKSELEHVVGDYSVHVCIGWLKTNSEHAAGYRPKPPASRRWKQHCGRSPIH